MKHTKKYSILGLSLLAVSAVTAAFVPAKDADNKAAINGLRTLSSTPFGSGDITCREYDQENDEVDPNCSFTNTGAAVNESSTSGAGDVNSVSINAGNQTASVTTAQAVDA